MTAELSKLIAELQKVALESEKAPEVRQVAHFQLDIRVFSDGVVKIESPQQQQVEAPAAQTKQDIDSVAAQAIKKTRRRRKPCTWLEEPLFQRAGNCVVIDSKEYASIQEAARTLRMHPYHIKQRCASAQWPTWTML
jgi:hypothetical protein